MLPNISLLCGQQLQMIHQVLSLALIICSAAAIWKGLVVTTGSESPVVVVLRYVK
jgi:hypothetical protein